MDRAVFQPGERVELIGGQLVVREPQGSPHAVAVLLVEVAEVRLAFDREHKGSLYARAHVPDYWIVNLVDHVLEVHRDPTPSADAPYGWRFSTRQRLGATDTVSPLRAPRARIAIADLLP